LCGKRGNTMTAPHISTVEEYENANERIAELTGATESSADKAELDELMVAVDKWGFDHSDTTGAVLTSEVATAQARTSGDPGGALRLPC